MKLLIELFEAEEDLSKAEELKQYLKDHCMKYIENHKSDGSYLIRGVEGMHKPSIADTFHVFETDPDRPPRDTRRILHDMINDYFDEKFNSKFRSEHVAFCYSNFVRSRVPDDYGTTYLIIPIGDYKMCYSPRVIDLFQSLDLAHALQGDIVQLFGFDNPEKNRKVLNKIGISDEIIKGIIPDMELFMRKMYECVTKYGPDVKHEFFEDFVSSHCVKAYRMINQEHADMLAEVVGAFLDNDSSGMIEFFNMLMDELDYRVGDFNCDSVYKSEVMLQCKSYVAIPNSFRGSLTTIIDDLIGDKNE